MKTESIGAEKDQVLYSTPLVNVGREGQAYAVMPGNVYADSLRLPQCN
jgi:hypothetical protein